MTTLRFLEGKSERAHKASNSGLAGWLLSKLSKRIAGQDVIAPRLALVERISLAPRQWLVLVEAEGQSFLVGSSAEGVLSMHPIHKQGSSHRSIRASARRVSW